MNIVSMGAGYVGGPTMAVMADQCRDHVFTVVDINQKRIDEWKSDQLPIYEPGLDNLVKGRRGVNLFFTTDIRSALEEADMVFISVNTPTKDSGEGAGMACDVSRVEACARQILECANKDMVVVEKTTVPVRTAGMLRQIFASSKHSIEVLSNPEFLAEGTAIENLLYPDRVIIGCSMTGAGWSALSELEKLYCKWVPGNRIITMDTFSSELSKLVSNAFLAQRVSSINSIAEICEKADANVESVAKAVGADERIGKHFLMASLGFGGSCFRKDVLSLVYIAQSLGLDEVAEYWHQVIKMNERQQDRLVARTVNACLGSVSQKKIAVFGFAFKAGTGDIRDTPAARVCYQLMREGAEVRVTDPKALETRDQWLEAGVVARRGGDIYDLPGVFRMYSSDNCRGAYVAAEECDAVIIATEWPEYAELDWQKIYRSMRKPAVLMDGRNLLNWRDMTGIGFRYLDIGRTTW